MPLKFTEETLDCYLDIRERCYALCALYEQLSHARACAQEKEKNNSQVVEKSLVEKYEAELSALAVDIVDFSQSASAELLNTSLNCLPKAVTEDLKTRILGVAA